MSFYGFQNPYILYFIDFQLKSPPSCWMKSYLKDISVYTACSMISFCYVGLVQGGEGDGGGGRKWSRVPSKGGP